MKIFDAHCDVLYKMFLDPTIEFHKSDKLQVNLDLMEKVGSKIQCFAIYIPASVHPDLAFHAALYMIDIFYEKIIKLHPKMRVITSKYDIMNLKNDEIGAILTLEGCDAIGKDLLKLKTLLRLGVTSVGLTWNFANEVADGSLEARGAGLSKFGKEVVTLLNSTQTWIDVSHLSEKGFWDVIEWGDYPFASHSNSYSLCPNPRNLKDEQIEAIIERDSVIGITFVPSFLSGKNQATIDDILRHLEHMCMLGGEKHVGFGSDFDGINEMVIGLENFGDYSLLINELYKYYTENQVNGFLFENMKKRYPKS
ncbi:dipeptidase [Bacillus sp. CGMCC 1.16607]|uniref:dipeptidase n=1 Tax=Bacillus sp. CGMCC 1.16607 TaxID=3351842 RepID=UPI00363F6A9F